MRPKKKKRVSRLKAVQPVHSGALLYLGTLYLCPHGGGAVVRWELEDVWCPVLLRLNCWYWPIPLDLLGLLIILEAVGVRCMDLDFSFLYFL